MLLASRGKCGLVSLLFLLAPLVSYAEDQAPSPVEVHTPEQDSTWKLSAEEEGVTIFSRKGKESDIKEVIGKGVIDAPPCRLFQVLGDLDSHAGFMPYIKANIVKSTSSEWKYGCQYLDLPWPIWDRFVHFRTHSIENYGENQCEYLVEWQKDETYVCTIEEVQEVYKDARPDPIVPLAVNGYWHLLPDEHGQKTLAYYYLFSDPGGDIPAWLQNIFAGDAILKLFRAVRERASMSDLYPPCECPQPATTDSLKAQARGGGYRVDSWPRR